jgi:hypothetical protein
MEIRAKYATGKPTKPVCSNTEREPTQKHKMRIGWHHLNGLLSAEGAESLRP